MSDKYEQQLKALRDSQLAAEASVHRDRRERIATAALAGLLQVPFGSETTDRQIAAFAIGIADALIAELDKKEGGA